MYKYRRYDDDDDDDDDDYYYYYYYYYMPTIAFFTLSRLQSSLRMRSITLFIHRASRM